MGEDSRTPSGWVVPLCWTAVMLDGYDLVVLGVVLPVLLSEHTWGMTTATATAASVIGLVGMTIGALTIGTVTDVIGRRKGLIWSVAIFSIFTLGCAFAPSLTVFAALRFLGGLGLGGCMPTAITRVTEHYTARGRANSASTTVMTGYHVGAVATALLGIVLIPEFGWRAMFVAGALPALALLPAMILFLSDSPPVTAVAHREGGSATARHALAGLFRDGMLAATLAFWVATFMGLVLVFGLNTWLPQIMREAGYPIGAALGLLLTLNAGAVVGMIVAGAVANHRGIRASTVWWFVGAAVFLAGLSLELPQVALYAVVFLAGVFVFSAQALVYAFTQGVYPDYMRATGLGWTAGIGRLGAICGPILGGALLAAGLAYPWGFYVFAAVASAAALAVSTIRPHGVGESAPDHHHPSEAIAASRADGAEHGARTADDDGTPP